MEIEILYSDPYLIACRKPAGLSSEADGVPRLLAAQLGITPPCCVHRLDMAVGGVMVYARGGKTAAALSEQIAAHETEKRYLAVACGCPQEPEGLMRDLLFKDSRQNKSFVVTRPRRGVRQAELRYRVLETAGSGGGTLTLVEVLLHTGRSHQIRVQFASRRMPLLGDGKYGGGSKYPIALFSHILCFSHPVTGQKLCFRAVPSETYPWELFHTIKIMH